MERKTEAERLAELRTRREQLAQQITKLENAVRLKERKADTRRKIIIGGAVIAHARLHPEFADTLQAVLSLAVTRPKDREAITGWFDIEPLKPEESDDLLLEGPSQAA
jgi:hypothetical protein